MPLSRDKITVSSATDFSASLADSRKSSPLDRENQQIRRFLPAALYHIKTALFSVAIYAFFFKAGNPFRVSHKGHMILSHFLHKKSPYNIPRAPIPTIVTFSILFIPYCPSFCMIILSYSHFLSLSRHAGCKDWQKKKRALALFRCLSFFQISDS